MRVSDAARAPHSTAVRPRSPRVAVRQWDPRKDTGSGRPRPGRLHQPPSFRCKNSFRTAKRCGTYARPPPPRAGKVFRIPAAVHGSRRVHAGQSVSVGFSLYAQASAPLFSTSDDVSCTYAATRTGAIVGDGGGKKMKRIVSLFVQTNTCSAILNCLLNVR